MPLGDSTAEADEEEDSNETSNNSDETSNDGGGNIGDDPRSVGVGPHRTEFWRRNLELGRYKNTNFLEDREALKECASLIVKDMTFFLKDGIYVPDNAPRDYKGI